MLNDQDVAHYLLNHPDFFDEHVSLLETIKLFSPHRKSAISLQERQIEILREKVRRFEYRLTELLRNSRDNDVFYQRLEKWLLPILAETDKTQLIKLILEGLKQNFEMPYVQLYLTDLDEANSRFASVKLWTNAQQTFAQNLLKPFCGSVARLNEQSSEVVDELLNDASNVLEEDLQSLAIVALQKSGNEDQLLGLLVMGATDAQRFQEIMATDFLNQIGKIVSSTLNQLLV